ncbi:MAG TPA: hypothetical protein VLT88_00955 [Desulfosarcina sp.]|nr:hypothetical protein [Desulfosarcina sp.]
MKRMLPFVALLLAACVHLPPVQPVGGERRMGIEQRVRSVFPQGRWQLVHTIEARFPGGRRTFLTGVVVLSTTASRLHCVLMSLDGFVLFEAVDDGEVSVKRAFGPFDHAEFAGGVMRDIRLIFMPPGMPPGGAIDRCGLFADGGEGCRFRAAAGVVDVIVEADGGWRIRQTAPPRAVAAQAPGRNGFSPEMTLAADGAAGYTLTMKLLSAEAVDRHVATPEEAP